jgi:hypothetical protein
LDTNLTFPSFVSHCSHILRHSLCRLFLLAEDLLVFRLLCIRNIHQLGPWSNSSSNLGWYQYHPGSCYGWILCLHPQYCYEYFIIPPFQYILINFAMLW